MTSTIPGDGDLWVTINQAAAHWHVTRVTVARWIRDAKVPMRRTPGGHPRVYIGEVAFDPNKRADEILNSLGRR